MDSREMIIMLDVSTKKHNTIAPRLKPRSVALGQLRTPLTRYQTTPSVPLGIDNGCFSGSLNRSAWRRIVEEDAKNPGLKFVALPDVVGDARRTLELYDQFVGEGFLQGVPRALVIQDGIEGLPIPWDSISAVFVGGTNRFKDGDVSMAVAKTAKILGKWVHVGRVNTFARAKHWMHIADSCDGSCMSRYDHMLAAVVDALTLTRPVKKHQDELFDID